jgi:uncharacterized protein
VKLKRESRFLDLLSRTTAAAIDHPFRFLGAALLAAIGSIYLAAQLEIRSSFEELLPSDVPSVAHIKELVRRVGGDGTVLVNIEVTGGTEGLAPAKALAPELAQGYLDLGPKTIRAVEWNVRPVESWYADHWPLFVSVADLEKARTVIKDEVKKAKRTKNPLLNLGGALDTEPPAPESESPAKKSEWLDPAHKLPRELVEERFARYEDGFFVHPDHKSLVLVVRPAGTALGVDEARRLLDTMRTVGEKHRAFLDAHHLRIGFGGSFPLFIAEYETILRDVASTALLCISMVLASLFLFYRDVRSTVSLAISVLTAVAVTFSLTRLAIGYLNTQTAFLGSIVVGNGINYGLIYLARVAQLRRSGVPLRPATIDGAKTAAQATLLASLATSVSFGTLVVAANRGFRHFGFIGGVGMLLCWVATFLLLPALLSIFEKIRPVRVRGTMLPPEHPEPPPAFATFFARSKAVVGVFAVLVAASIAIFAKQLPNAIERNLDNLTNELKGEDELVRDNDRAQSSLGKSIAGSIALLPSREAADAFCDAVKRRASASPRYDEVIEGCDTVSTVVPRAQDEKLAIVADITRRLSDLVLDELPPVEGDRLRRVRTELGVQKPLAIEDAPPTLVDRFKERDGTVGRLAVVTARPSAQLELAPRLDAFVSAVRNVEVDGDKFDASGENVIFSDLLQNIEHEGPTTTLLSLAGVCVLVGLFFRRGRMSIEVIGALIAGIILMGGVAALLGLKINFFNFIVFPITFGIAVDYGANVVVRIRDRGGDVLGSLREVGPAVALCSWTSIIGYGSLVFALNRALRSFGWYAMIGEVTTIVTALILLPALTLVLGRHPPRTFGDN